MPTRIGSKSLSAALAILFAFVSEHVMAQAIQGTASYKERMALPSGAGSQNPGLKPVEGTYWKAIELMGKPTPTQDANREAHLLFQPAGRVSGSDGCNRFTGTYTLKGDAVSFGQMAGTRMACINASAEIEQAFRVALQSATRLNVVGDRLELFDGTGQRVAAFSAVAQAPSAAARSGLERTAWQLVAFRGSDDKTLTPGDGSNYTIDFRDDGQLNARIDCNRGRGTWTSSGANQVQFGPLALTRAKCAAGSMHDQMVKQWGYVRSYVIKDGHLFLSLMADGGIYEFEPMKQTKP
jgi:heat shock protein HslJ